MHSLFEPTTRPVLWANEEIRNSSNMKKSLNVAPKRMVGPVPFKSKGGPSSGQKPLNRIRAQNRVRNKQSDSQRDSAGFRSTVEVDIRQRECNISSLQEELVNMREEKRKTEQRLQRMEDEHRKHQDSIRKEAEKQAKERESQLKEEIHMLRNELHQQSTKLQENFNVVLSLQEQLVKVQSDQLRMSTVEQNTPRQSAQKESRICSIQ